MSTVVDSIEYQINLSELKNEFGLYYGKTGVSLVYYILSEIYRDKNLHRQGQEHLQDVLENFDQENIDLANGLAGIGWLIDFMIRKRIVTDQLYKEALNEIDDEIYKGIIFLNTSNISLAKGAIGVLYYLTQRLVTNNYSQLGMFREQCIFELIRILLNKIQNQLQSSTPFPHDYQTLKKTISILEKYKYSIRELSTLKDTLEGLRIDVGNDQSKSKIFLLLSSISIYIPPRLNEWKCVLYN